MIKKKIKEGKTTQHLQLYCAPKPLLLSLSLISVSPQRRARREILAWCSQTNHVNVLCMESITNTQFHTQYTYIIGRKHSHVVLPDHVSISRTRRRKNIPCHSPEFSTREKGSWHCWFGIRVLQCTIFFLLNFSLQSNKKIISFFFLFLSSPFSYFQNHCNQILRKSIRFLWFSFLLTFDVALFRH